MEGAQLENESGKCTKNVTLYMTQAEGKRLIAVMEAAVEKKVRGSKPMLKKLSAVLFCY